jgi:hypothetical protein
MARLAHTMQPERYETFIKALTDLTRQLRRHEHLRAAGHGGPGLVENWEPEKAADEARKKLVAIWAKYKD